MKTRWMGVSFAVVSLVALGVASSRAGDDDDRVFRARLSPYNEVPALNSAGTGSFAARLSRDGTTLAFRLTYADLDGNVTAAHIHFAQAGVNGGVSAFLCGGGTKPPCPPAPATVTGTIVAADVIGPVAQGIAVGDFAALVRAMRNDRTYANVHSTVFPGGNIRGQIEDSRH